MNEESRRSQEKEGEKATEAKAGFRRQTLAHRKPLPLAADSRGSSVGGFALDLIEHDQARFPAESALCLDNRVRRKDLDSLRNLDDAVSCHFGSSRFFRRRRRPAGPPRRRPRPRRLAGKTRNPIPLLHHAGKKKKKAPACCYNAKPNATRVLGVHAKWPARYVRASSAVDHFFFFHPRHLSAMTPTSKNARTLVSSFLLFFFFVFRVCEHPSRLV